MTETETPKTFTQEEVDSLIAKRLHSHREEVEALKAKYADYDDIKTQAATLATERDTWASERTEFEKRATGAETRLLAYDVAAETELPLALAPRLTGSTRDEMLADAAKLKSIIPSQATPKTVTPTAPPALKPTTGKGRAAEALRGVVRDRA